MPGVSCRVELARTTPTRPLEEPVAESDAAQPPDAARALGRKVHSGAGLGQMAGHVAAIAEDGVLGVAALVGVAWCARHRKRDERSRKARQR